MTTATLYQDLQAAGIECANWQSDLYFPDTKEAREILAKYPYSASISKPFKNNINGTVWREVPFAFDPFWAARATGAAA